MFLMCARAHPRTHIHTHNHTSTHAPTHTHTHTSTYTPHTSIHPHPHSHLHPSYTHTHTSACSTVMCVHTVHFIYTAVFICRSASSITLLCATHLHLQYALPFLAVYVPAGNYLISSKVPISIPKAVSLVGTYRYVIWSESGYILHT